MQQCNRQATSIKISLIQSVYYFHSFIWHDVIDRDLHHYPLLFSLFPLSVLISLSGETLTPASKTIHSFNKQLGQHFFWISSETAEHSHYSCKPDRITSEELQNHRNHQLNSCWKPCVNFVIWPRVRVLDECEAVSRERERERTEDMTLTSSLTLT